MTDRRPVYVVGPDTPLRRRLTAALEGRAPRLFDGVDAFTEAGSEPGLAFLTPDLPAESVLGAVTRLAVGRGEWTPVLVQEEDGALVGRTLTLGYPHLVADALPADGGEPDPSTFLELRAVLRDVSRARHDINNPLTSALAETQLLLMDARESELRDGLETVQEQLRRIRDLVAGTVHLRLQD